MRSYQVLELGFWALIQWLGPLINFKTEDKFVGYLSGIRKY